jgi:hypothetical protein
MSVVSYDSATVAAAGTSISDATQLTRLGKVSSFIVTNNASGAHGVILPTDPSEGDVVELYASEQSGPVTVYSADTINGVADNSAQRGAIICRYTGATYGWYCITGSQV